MRGQVSIEYIIILVVMLVILATVSLPAVEKMEEDVTNTGTAINLASIQQRIKNTAEDLSLSGCGSHKQITVYIDADAFNAAEVSWNDSHINGRYLELNGTERILKPMQYPGTVNITKNDPDTTDQYWTVELNKTCGGAKLEDCIGDCTL